MKTLAVIPARGGSKGLPGKNLKLLAGKPLIAHTIEQALKSGVCDAVVVSTEDEAIARVAREYGAQTPFLRPADLATDTAKTEPVVKHALETYEELTGTRFDIVVFLQPTDVFRTPEMIRECVNRLKADPKLDSVFAGYKTHKNYWRYTEQGLTRLAPDLATYKPRQEREQLNQMLYREDAGLASAVRSEVVRSGRRLGDHVDVVPVEDFCTSIDIHQPFDLWLVEKIMTEWEGTASSNGANPWLGTDAISWAQSIRNGYARAFILFALHETGVFESLRRQGPQSVQELSESCQVDPHLLDGVLHFLLHADCVLKKEGEKFGLTERAQWLFADPVMAMSFGAVGAYSCLLSELVPTLRGEKRYGVDFIRRGDWVAKGSFYTGKGNYPWIVSQLKELGVKTVADLGCGSGDVLIGFCGLDAGLKGIGIDISPEALEEARRRVEAAGMSERIRLIQGDMFKPEAFEPHVKEVEAFHGMMTFHEFLRDGEEAVVRLFKNMKDRFPGRYLIVGEFNRVSDEEYQAMPYPQRIHPLFYQYIIHPLTWQGLPISKERWLDIFRRAGLKILGVKEDFPFRLVEYVLQF